MAPKALKKSRMELGPPPREWKKGLEGEQTLEEGNRTPRGASRGGNRDLKIRKVPRSDQVLGSEGHLKEGSRTSGCVLRREVGP